MSVRLFILGILQQQRTHGYEIRKKLQEWGVENWAHLNWSSVYHALRQMEKEGLIEKQKIVENKNRPAKDVYTILENGENTFFQLLRTACVEVTVDKNPVYIVLMYLHYLPNEERIALLQKRLENLQHLQEHVESKKAHIESSQEERRIEIVFALQRDLAQRQTDINWTKTLIAHYTEQDSL